MSFSLEWESQVKEIALFVGVNCNPLRLALTEHYQNLLDDVKRDRELLQLLQKDLELSLYVCDDLEIGRVDQAIFKYGDLETAPREEFITIVRELIPKNIN